jgi:hypothetical protein
MLKEAILSIVQEWKMIFYFTILLFLRAKYLKRIPLKTLGAVG